MGKSSAIAEIVVERLKRGGKCYLEWLVRMFNEFFCEGKVLRKLESAGIVPLYKGKRDCLDGVNY